MWRAEIWVAVSEGGADDDPAGKRAAGVVSPGIGLSRGGTMSGIGTTDKKHADDKQRWAALDKRHERLFRASDRASTDNDGKDNDVELKAAS